MAFTAGRTMLGKKTLFVWAKRSVGETGAADFTSWVLIGVCGEKVSIKAPQADTQKLNDGTEAVISKNIEFEADVLEVTSANYTSLLSTVNCNIDVALDTLSTGYAGTPSAGGVIALKVNLFPELNIVSNDQNKILLKGKKEISATDSSSITIG